MRRQDKEELRKALIALLQFEPEIEQPTDADIRGANGKPLKIDTIIMSGR